MSETDYKGLEIGDVDENGQNVLISRVADRPNAFNSYRESKMSAADVKAMFDRPFLHVKKKVNALIAFLAGRDKAVEDRLAAQDTKLAAQDTKLAAQDTKLAEFEKSTDDKLAAQDEEIARISEKVDSINNYDLTEADMQHIAQIVLSEYVDGDEVSY
jgi:septal ring factor EnvC (AmiA/AmiB activator)